MKNPFVRTRHPLPTPSPLTVAVDIDGVLYELVPALRQWLHRECGLPLSSMPDPGVYDLEVAWHLPSGMLIEQLVAGVRAGVLFWQGEAHAPGLAGLRALKDAGYRVVLISARDLPGIRDLCVEATTSWLAKPEVGAVYDELVITNVKNEVPFHFLVDDYEKHVRLAHAVGRGAVLLNRGYNASVAADLLQAPWERVPSVVRAFEQTRSNEGLTIRMP